MSSGEQEQAARSKLRIGFLDALKQLSGSSATFVTCEGNSLQGKLVGIDRDTELLGVENLNTPTGPLAHAILRVADIDIIKVSKISEENE